MPLNFLEESTRINEHCGSLSISPTEARLIVSVADQQMALIRNREIVQIYQISTSSNPPSCLADSYGTPTGLHTIADKIGKAQPEGLVFKGRVPTGKHFSVYSDPEAKGNLITSRILRLRGLEPGKNAGPGCDSYERYIYIHGTNHEARIGQPFSGGCIEMLNADVIQLFDQVNCGDLVWIC